jgi:hypothetical protein
MGADPELDEQKNANIENRESIRHGIFLVLALAGWSLAIWWFVELSG